MLQGGAAFTHSVFSSARMHAEANCYRTRAVGLLLEVLMTHECIMWLTMKGGHACPVPGTA